jgi:hypothetical protein
MLDENGALNVGAIYAKWNSAAGKHRTES